MNKLEEIIEQIKSLSVSVSEENYDAEIKRGYELLVKLHDLGAEKESVYQSLLAYHSGLEDGIVYDYIADLLDYVMGWCSAQNRIWSDDMKCPICSNEMQAGGLIIDGVVTGWVPLEEFEKKGLEQMKRKVFRTIGGEVSALLGQTKVPNAYLCESCNKIIGVFDVII